MSTRMVQAAWWPGVESVRLTIVDLRGDGSERTASSEVFRANLHDLERIHPPESDDERAQRHERLAIAHTEEYIRLTGKEPEQRKPVEIGDDDLEWRAWKRHDYGGQQVGVEPGVIVLHKPTGIAAISTDERSQHANKRAALIRLEQALAITPAPSLTAEDLRELQRALDAWRQRREINNTSSWVSAFRLLDRLDAEGKLGRSGR